MQLRFLTVRGTAFDAACCGLVVLPALRLSNINKHDANAVLELLVKKLLFLTAPN